jgi:hypothetical protein
MSRLLRRGLAAAILATFALPSPARAVTDWRTEREGAVWWLRPPAGERFFSIGVNVVDAEPERAPRHGTLQYRWSPAYPSPAAWVDATRARLLGWGFNTLGGWSRREAELGLPYTPVLSFGQQVNAIWGDPFDPETPARMLEDARRKVARHPGGPLRIGYYTDNEIGWWNAPLLLWFLEQEPANHTRQRLITFLRQRYPQFSAFRRDFVVPAEVDSFDVLAGRKTRALLAAGGEGARTLRAWTAIVVERYYAAAEAAVRAADPRALVLGDRLPIYWDEDALRAAGGHVDVLAVNHDVATTGGWVAPYFFEGLRDLVPAPVLVSEWFFASRENRTGNANRGQLMTVDTQAERARGAAAAARHFAGFPNLVGLHWFQLSDQPPGGRSDGEDYSHGLVDVRGAPYEEFTRSLAAANHALPQLHATARWDAELEAGLPLTIPAATPGARDGEGPLDAWDLAATRLHFPRGRPGLDVPFADVHLAFTDDALLLGVLGQDFFNLDLYERDPMLLGDTLTLHLLVSSEAGVDPDVAGQRARHVAIHFEPTRIAQGPDFPPSEVRVQAYVPKGYVVSPDGSQTPQPRIRARRLRAISPRFDAVIAIPRELLGLAGVDAAEKIDLELALEGFLHGRAFTLSGRPLVRALSEAPSVRATLAPADGEPPAAGPLPSASAAPADPRRPAADPAPNRRRGARGSSAR